MNACSARRKAWRRAATLSEPLRRVNPASAASVLIMSAVAVSIGSAAILILYETVDLEERQRLVDALRSQTRLIAAIVRQEQRLEPQAAQAWPRASSRCPGRGKRAQAGVDFVLGERREDQIVILTLDRNGDLPHLFPSFLTGRSRCVARFRASPGRW